MFLDIPFFIENYVWCKHGSVANYVQINSLSLSWCWHILTIQRWNKNNVGIASLENSPSIFKHSFIFLAIWLLVCMIFVNDYNSEGGKKKRNKKTCALMNSCLKVELLDACGQLFSCVWMGDSVCWHFARCMLGSQGMAWSIFIHLEVIFQANFFFFFSLPVFLGWFCLFYACSSILMKRLNVVMKSFMKMYIRSS